MFAHAIDFQKRSFSPYTAEIIQKHLSEIERYTDICNKIADWLHSKEHDQAKTYQDECTKWKAENEVYSGHIMTMINFRMPLPPDQVSPGYPVTSMPVEGLRPPELTADSTKSTLRTWKEELFSFG